MLVSVPVFVTCLERCPDRIERRLTADIRQRVHYLVARSDAVFVLNVSTKV